MKQLVQSINISTLALLFVAASLLLPISSQVTAAPLINRRVTLGSSAPSEVTTHRYQFTIVSASAVGSIEFEYCTNTPFAGTACTAPAGLNVAAATLSTQTGETGFSVHANTTVNRLVLGRAAVATTPQVVTYNFSNVTNPSTASESVFIRISTFASTDGTGARTDDGAVVFSIVGGLGSVGFVPPYLNFCKGITVALNCTSSNGFTIDVGQLGSNVTRTATTEFSTATNDPNGYNIYTLGTTMTSGNNIITPMNPASGSAQGLSQFGINLRANGNPFVGAEKTGGGTGNALTGYDAPNIFKYNNGEAIARSLISTDFTKFTVSYIINISNNQPPGRYSTTITYLAMASF